MGFFLMWVTGGVGLVFDVECQECMRWIVQMYEREREEEEEEEEWRWRGRGRGESWWGMVMT